MLTINWKKGKDKLTIDDDEMSAVSPAIPVPSSANSELKSKK
tara:strand:- start:255 stop:380 length:126 start_codon:yes stop_codon:yes gene_type:complete